MNFIDQKISLCKENHLSVDTESKRIRFFFPIQKKCSIQIEQQKNIHHSTNVVGMRDSVISLYQTKRNEPSVADGSCVVFELIRTN